MLNPVEDIPFDVDMERELLGALLLKKGELVPKVAAILEPSDFYSAINRFIYQAILNLYNCDFLPNTLLVLDELKKIPEYEDNEKYFIEAVLSLSEIAYTTAYAEGHVKIIKDKSVRRQLIKFSERLKRDAANPKADFTQILSNAESVIRSMTDGTEPTSLQNYYDYFNQKIISDIDNLRPYAERKTNFENIDSCQIFSPGLYVIGATPSAGKTTFCWQLLNQLAKSGETCIFCSYEMSMLELYAKELARQTFVDNNKQILNQGRKICLTAAEIRRGNMTFEVESTLLKILEDRESVNAKGASIFELRDETIDDLLRMLKPHCVDKEKAPVVCLDYLQIVPPSNDKQLISDKARIDDIVHKLKTFQRETNTTFIVVSSFNRTNYAQQVSFESFKESGNIEYTADVVWAMQLDVVNHLQNGVGIRQQLEDAKRQQPRKVQLKCLKNRQGMNYDCYFDYYAAHDYFEVGVGMAASGEYPDEETDTSPQVEKARIKV